MTNTNKVQELFDKLNWQDLSEQDQERLQEALQGRMQNLIIHTFLGSADEAQKTRLTQALESGGDVELVITEIASEIPDFDQILEQAIITEFEHLKEIGQQATS